MNTKIILGTVQLGLNYGINNTAGKPSEDEAFAILDFAQKNGISILDCADVYGDAVEVLGRYNGSRNNRFKIINKFKVDGISLEEKLLLTLERLGQTALYCYMYHQFSDWENKGCAEPLRVLKTQGRLTKIGVSIYSTEQLSCVLADPDVDIIQLPGNILDLDQAKISQLKKAKAAGKEIHVRSVYLQGLFFKDPAALSGNLQPLAPYVERIRSIARTNRIDISKAALNFILQQNFVDYVVLGVDKVSQLKENLDSIDPQLNVALFQGIHVAESEKYLLNPSNWKA